MKNVFILAFAAFSLVSCGKIKDPVFNGIGNVRMEGLGLQASMVKLDMLYFNPNKFKGQLKNAEGDAWLDSSYLGHFVVDSAIRVPANSDFIIPVKLSMDMKYILKNSMAALINKEVQIRITGKAKAGRGGFYRNVALNYTGKINAAELFNRKPTEIQ